MNFQLLTRTGRLLALGLATWAGLGTSAWAQVQPTPQLGPQPARPTSATLRAAAKTPTLAPTSLATQPNPHLDERLQLLYQETTTLKNSGPVDQRTALAASHPEFRFSGAAQAVPAVLVRITAQDVTALLPGLLSRGFKVVASYPNLHFVEGTLPVDQLSGDGRGVEALATRGLLGVLPSYQPQNNVGVVTSQADHGLEAARTRAYRRNGVSVSGAGVRIGVLSDSFDSVPGAADADVASGDLPAAGVQVISDILGGSDEGRAMCQLIHDLAPDSPLAFSSAYNGEGDFAQQIRNLANAAQGNCSIIVDDVGYFTEPYFQDGVIAQAVNDVVARGVSYFSSAGNSGSASYENASPQFVADSANPAKRVLNFDATGAKTDTRQRIVLPVPTAAVDGGQFTPFLQWSDPFYTTGGVKTNLDLYLIAVKNGVLADTVARGRTNNIATSSPYENLTFTNTAATGTTTFDLVIVLRGGVAPTRVKYLNRGTVSPSEWYGASTIVGHAASASAFATAAVSCFNQRVPESFTSRGGALPFLFSPTGTALATPEVRQKPNAAAIDGTDTSFFGGDADGNGFPNFFGTSAAAPHAAAVAALLRSAEPSLTPTQVYSRLAGTAHQLGATTTNAFVGPGLINAFTAVYGPVAATTPPYVEDFERMTLPLNWTVNSTVAGRAQVLNNDGPSSGKYQLLLDAIFLYTGTTQSLNEATCYLNNATGSGLQLSFRQRRYAAETDEAMPAQFTTSSNTDGVALSVNGGTTWYRIFDLTGTNATTSYQTNTIDLSQFAAANGLTLGADVRVRFQQYGGGGALGATVATRRGRAFDDVAITAANPGPVALFNAGPATTGCPGLQVQYADTSLYKTAATTYAWTFVGGTPATSTLRNPLVTYATPGHFPVTLSVRTAAGTATRTDTGFVFVSGRAPQASISATATTICRGGTVTFGSTARYCPSTYTWSFPGGSPATSTSPNPGAVVYANAGTYTATLVVRNAYGSFTSTVIIDVDGRALPFAENFENTFDLPRGWSLVTPSRFPWLLFDGIVGRSGVASTVLALPLVLDDNVGETVAVHTPAINLTGVASPKLLFDLAYRPGAATAGGVPTRLDSLTVRVADACTGAILGKPYAKSARNGLSTGASITTGFVPAAASDWRQELVDLTPFAGKSVILQFRGYNANGNNIFLDNVQVGNALLSLTSAASAVGLSAWPVPTPRGTSLNVHLPAYTGSVALRLVDNLGRVVWQQQLQQTGAALERTLTLPFAPGLYNLVYSPASGTPAARRIVLE